MTSRSDTLIFPLAPVPASRPRHATRGKGKNRFVSTYFDGKYADFRKEAAKVVYETIGLDFEMFNQWIQVEVEFVVTKPKSNKKEYPKPDIDNYVKAIFDVCNDRVWTDDFQICRTTATKRWAESDEEPHIKMTVTTVA